MSSNDESKLSISKVVSTLEKWKGDDHSIPSFEKIIQENDVTIYHELKGKVLLDRRQ